MLEASGQRFHLYNNASFYKYAKDFIKEEPRQKSVQEASAFVQSSTTRQLRASAHAERLNIKERLAVTTSQESQIQRKLAFHRKNLLEQGNNDQKGTYRRARILELSRELERAQVRRAMLENQYRTLLEKQFAEHNINFEVDESDSG